MNNIMINMAFRLDMNDCKKYSKDKTKFRKFPGGGQSSGKKFQVEL